VIHSAQCRLCRGSTWFDPRLATVGISGSLLVCNCYRIRKGLIDRRPLSQLFALFAAEQYSRLQLLRWCTHQASEVNTKAEAKWEVLLWEIRNCCLRIVLNLAKATKLDRRKKYNPDNYQHLSTYADLGASLLLLRIQVLETRNREQQARLYSAVKTNVSSILLLVANVSAQGSEGWKTGNTAERTWAGQNEAKD
jgi:hypothetical protein